MAREEEGAGQRPSLYVMIAWLSVLPAGWLGTVALVLIAVIGVGDYLTGPYLSFAVGYVIPVFLASTAGPRLGLTAAAAATVTWTGIEVALRPVAYPNGQVVPWNVGTRFLVLGLVAALVQTLAAKLTDERRLSRTDALTGLANVRGFLEAADTEITRMCRTGDVPTVAYLDLDDFKIVNDTHGHAWGDQLLASVGRTMAAAAGSRATVGRIGGDEFAILLPGSDSAHARRQLDAIRAGLPAATPSGTSAVRASVGLATFRTPPSCSGDLLNAADKVMYLAKREGKMAVGTDTPDAAPAIRT